MYRPLLLGIIARMIVTFQHIDTALLSLLYLSLSHRTSFIGFTAHSSPNWISFKILNPCKRVSLDFIRDCWCYDRFA